MISKEDADKLKLEVQDGTIQNEGDLSGFIYAETVIDIIDSMTERKIGVIDSAMSVDALQKIMQDAESSMTITCEGIYDPDEFEGVARHALVNMVNAVVLARNEIPLIVFPITQKLSPGYTITIAL